jgi:hypothetical protein
MDGILSEKPRVVGVGILMNAGQARIVLER